MTVEGNDGATSGPTKAQQAALRHGLASGMVREGCARRKRLGGWTHLTVYMEAKR